MCFGMYLNKLKVLLILFVLVAYVSVMLFT